MPIINDYSPHSSAILRDKKQGKQKKINPGPCLQFRETMLALLEQKRIKLEIEKELADEAANNG